MVTTARQTSAFVAAVWSRSRSLTATLAARVAQYIDQTVGWPRLPKAIGLAVLIGLRHQLRPSTPESDQRLLDPNPWLISRTLLTRDSFQPATTMNLLAAAWIQFEVHDWFAHGSVATRPWVVPLRDDDPWPQRPMRVERTPPDPHPG